VKRRALWALGLAVTLAATSAALVRTTTAEGSDGPLQQVRDATRQYRNVDTATDAGYVQFFGCVHEPLAGSMGIHFVNGRLARDTTLDPATPEALTYEVRPNGQLDLVGVEYIVFQDAWDAGHAQPPSLFGQPFMLVASPNRFGIPAFYALHAWAWKSNPTGPFKDWNPKVLCPGTEGHQTPTAPAPPEDIDASRSPVGYPT
jgi:hypothetical protein